MMDKSRNMLDLGRKIKQARTLAGLTQEQLAERIGVSRTAISRFELGEIEPGIRNLAALAQTLGVSCDWLLGLEPEKQKGEKLTPEAERALEALIRALRDSFR